MPEGDTLHRIARALQPLVGQRVAALSLPRQGLGASVAGDVVDEIVAVGKHLLIGFGGGLCVHTHLKMTGVWHRYAAGQAWRRPTSTAVVVLRAGAFEAVCFGAPLARLVERRRAWREVVLPLSRIDLVADTFDAGEALARLRLLSSLPIGVALLEQRAVAGIGNVYKSEGLFRAALDPFAPLSAVDDDRLAALLDDLRALMRANVFAGAGPPTGGTDGVPAGRAVLDAVQAYRYRRTTTTGLATTPAGTAARNAPVLGATRTTRSGCEVGKGPIAVYGRAGQPCFLCGAAVAMQRQGPLQRSTYFCLRCQGVGSSSSSPSSSASSVRSRSGVSPGSSPAPSPAPSPGPDNASSSPASPASDDAEGAGAVDVARAPVEKNRGPRGSAGTM